MPAAASRTGAVDWAKQAVKAQSSVPSQAGHMPKSKTLIGLRKRLKLSSSEMIWDARWTRCKDRQESL